jgi:hypothetical protein
MTKRPQHARLTLPGVGSIPALVEIDGGQASAVLLARPLQPLEGILGEDIEIHITTGRGVLRLDARIAAVPAAERMELEVRHRHELQQRRSFARVNTFLEVVVVSHDGEKEISAAVVNISAAGAVISNIATLSAGDAVDLSVTLAAQDPPIQIGARVVRQVEKALTAVHFERVRESDRERIVRFVLGRQREEQRKGTGGTGFA